MEIRIRQFSFQLPEPFQPGHVLNPAEARALNGLWAENIRNNLAKEVGKMADGGPLPAEALAGLQEMVEQYATGYKFGRGPGRKASGGLQAEIEVVVREWALARAHTRGQAQADPRDLEALKAEPSVVQEAQRRLTERQEIAARTLAEELLCAPAPGQVAA